MGADVGAAHVSKSDMMQLKVQRLRLQVRQYYAEAKSFYRRRSSVPLLVEVNHLPSLFPAPNVFCHGTVEVYLSRCDCSTGRFPPFAPLHT